MLGSILAACAAGYAAYKGYKALTDDDDYNNTRMIQRYPRPRYDYNSSEICYIYISHWICLNNQWGFKVNICADISVYEGERIDMVLWIKDGSSGEFLSSYISDYNDNNGLFRLVRQFTKGKKDKAIYSFFIPYEVIDLYSIDDITYTIGIAYANDYELFFLEEFSEYDNDRYYDENFDDYYDCIDYDQKNSAFFWNIPNPDRVKTAKDFFLFNARYNLDERYNYLSENEAKNILYKIFDNAIDIYQISNSNFSEKKESKRIINYFFAVNYFDDAGIIKFTPDEVYNNTKDFNQWEKNAIVIALVEVLILIGFDKNKIYNKLYYVLTDFGFSEKYFYSITGKFLTPDLSEYLNILEIQEPITIDKVKNAYRRKCKEFHPDRYQDLNKKMQDFAASELIKAQEACNYLLNYLNE